MDGEEVVGSAPGGGAASAGGAEPASSPAVPSVPASTPAAEPTPAAPSTPTAPSGAEPVRDPGETAAAYLQRLRTYEDAQPKPPELPKPAVPLAPAQAAPAAQPAEPTPAKPAEAPKPPEQVAPTQAEPLSAKLSQALQAKPELAEGLKAAGIDPEQLFEGLSLAPQAREFLEVYPGGPEDARFARQQAEVLANMDMAATDLQPGDLQSTAGFIQNVLTPLSYVLDPETGQPVMIEVPSPDGRMMQVPQTDGTIVTFVENVGQVYLDKIAWDAEQMLKDPNNAGPAEDLKAAIDIVKAHLAGKLGHSTQELPEELKARASELDARQQSMDARDRDAAVRNEQEANQRFEQFKESAITQSNQKTDAEIENWLNQTSLAISASDTGAQKESKEFLRNSITQDIRNRLQEKLGSDRLFLGKMEQIQRRGQNESTKTKLVSAYLAAAKGYLAAVAEPVLKAAGHHRVTQSQQRLDKIATQEQASRMEPRATGTAPALPRTQTTDDLQVAKEARAQLRSELNREPTTRELLDRCYQLEARQRQPASA